MVTHLNGRASSRGGLSVPRACVFSIYRTQAFHLRVIGEKGTQTSLFFLFYLSQTPTPLFEIPYPPFFTCLEHGARSIYMTSMTFRDIVTKFGDLMRLTSAVTDPSKFLTSEVKKKVKRGQIFILAAEVRILFVGHISSSPTTSFKVNLTSEVKKRSNEVKFLILMVEISNLVGS